MDIVQIGKVRDVIDRNGCQVGTASFLGVKCGRGVLLTTHPLLVPRSWKSRAIPLPTLWTTSGPVEGSFYTFISYLYKTKHKEDDSPKGYRSLYHHRHHQWPRISPPLNVLAKCFTQIRKSLARIDNSYVKINPLAPELFFF